MKPRLRVLNDITAARYFFSEDFDYNKAILEKYLDDESISVVRDFRAVLKDIEPYSASHLEQALRRFAEEKALKAKDVIHPLRVYITGTDGGPSLFETLELIGRDRCLKRLDNIIEKYEKEISKK